MKTSPIQDSWLTVTELNDKIRNLLEDGLPFIRVEAEISDLRAPPSGHLYCTLIDGESRIRAVVWRTTRRRLPKEPRSGERVQITGRIAVYSPRGEYQVVIEGMREIGSGDERQRMMLLHARLTAEGLFDEKSKKPLPFLPQIIGVVTSKTGAALQDIIRVLNDRFDNYHLILSSTLVQGVEAPEQIAAALDRLVEDGRSEVIICGRGGGSAEDLSAFNSEIVVRAIHRSTIPVVSAVGHEVDQTLADLVADARSATPSAAAQLVLPQKNLLEDRLNSIYKQLIVAAQQHIALQRGKLSPITNSLLHPATKINHARMRCDDLSERLFEAANGLLPYPQKKLHELKQRLLNWPKNRYFSMHQTRLNNSQHLLNHHSQKLLTNKKEQLKALINRLHAVSPKGVLQRGYAIIHDEKGDIVRDGTKLKHGAIINAQLAHGNIVATVNKKTVNK
ncbi:MAG: exodeoxyribonuclease VII large subunit [Magnetococcales bacterium]|nr:exodeoxyribonuclease VII large subunit [Magnetococcales bacterium]